MIYPFSCPRCGNVDDLVRSVADRNEPALCTQCGEEMMRILFMGIRASKGKKQYARPIVSDSLAVSPDQIAEHRRMFPNIQVTKEGQPVFDNFSDHEAYLKKCNVVKGKGKSRKGSKGRRIA